MMNAMLVSSIALENLWGQVIMPTCHLQNRILQKRTGKIFYELWKGYPPNLKYLKCKVVSLRLCFLIIKS